MNLQTPAVERRSSFGFFWFGTSLRQIKDVAAKRVAFLLLFLSAGLVLVQPCRAASIGFENTGSLATARSNYTATLLLNGKVLVAGGVNGVNSPGRGTVRSGERDLDNNRQPRYLTLSTHGDIAAQRQGARRRRDRRSLLLFCERGTLRSGERDVDNDRQPCDRTL